MRFLLVDFVPCPEDKMMCSLILPLAIMRILDGSYSLAFVWLVSRITNKDEHVPSIATIEHIRAKHKRNIPIV